MTFIVVEDFILNATLIDPTRLGKQRIEAKQIVNAILKGKGGWVNHPITVAWRPYLNALKYYANCIIKEFERRGYNNTMPLYKIPKVIVLPWWVKWSRLHQSHRAMLMRKDPFYYKGKFEVEEEYTHYGYIWPGELTKADRDRPLAEITAPIPAELINPVFCKAVIKSGKNAGQYCNRLVKTKGIEMCKVHSK